MEIKGTMVAYNCPECSEEMKTDHILNKGIYCPYCAIYGYIDKLYKIAYLFNNKFIISGNDYNECIRKFKVKVLW